MDESERRVDALGDTEALGLAVARTDRDCGGETVALCDTESDTLSDAVTESDRCDALVVALIQIDHGGDTEAATEGLVERLGSVGDAVEYTESDSDCVMESSDTDAVGERQWLAVER